jgi:hypothetical protein
MNKDQCPRPGHRPAPANQARPLVSPPTIQSDPASPPLPNWVQPMGMCFVHWPIAETFLAAALPIRLRDKDDVSSTVRGVLAVGRSGRRGERPATVDSRWPGQRRWENASASSWLGRPTQPLWLAPDPVGKASRLPRHSRFGQLLRHTARSLPLAPAAA